MGSRYDEITPPSADTALQPGGFKARDEARRAEAMQRRRIKYGERLDRNIARAGRKGDNQTVNALLNIKSALTDGRMQAPGGITNYADREQRVKDGMIKGAEARWKAGQIGRVSQDNAFAGAPPADTATPGIREESPEGAARRNINEPVQINGRDALFASGGDDVMRAAVVMRDQAYGPSSSVGESFAETEARKRREASKSGAFGSEAMDRANGIVVPSKRQEFAADLDRSSLVQTDMSARDRAYKRGEALGVSRRQIQDRMGWETDESVNKRKASEAKKKYDIDYGASDSYVSDSIDKLDPAKFSPEMIAQIRKNTQRISPEDRKWAVREGRDKASWGSFNSKKRAAARLEAEKPLRQLEKEISASIDALIGPSRASLPL